MGARRILALLAGHGIPATFFKPTVSALLHPGELRRYVAEGHGVGVHGWIHERTMTLAPAEERELALRSAGGLEKGTGARPVVCHPRPGRPVRARAPRSAGPAVNRP